MKLMIASDIHGSAFYCRSMIEAFEREEADRLLLLGDILYHGPRNDLPAEYAPKKVIAMLNPLKRNLLCVRGNCDTEVDQMVLEFPVLAEYCLLELDEYTETGQAPIIPVGKRCFYRTASRRSSSSVIRTEKMQPIRR